MRHTVYTTYEELSHSEQRTGNCPVCGARRKRSRTFTQTINPWNTDPDTGAPRTRKQIYAALREQGQAWVVDFTCNTPCEAKR
mgnify:CR=1 FL=1